MTSFILKVLLFAITITFLLAWGYVKQQRKNEELLNELYRKCENKIVKELQAQGTLTGKEIEEIIYGTKASLFWSKNRLQVTDAKIVMKNLMADMIRKGTLIEEVNKGSKKYKLMRCAS
ncbi:MAG: hypothetical protein ACOYVK_03085 [Bacillota bacterium]